MASSFDTEYETPEMENLAKLAENLVYRLPGCSDIMVRKTIQEVYRDFCRRSCCLCGRRRFTLDSSGDVAVAPMFGGLVDCVAGVWYNRRPLGKRDYVANGTRIAFRDCLVPSEGCDEKNLPRVEVSFVEIPKINSEEMPVFFAEKYGEAICSGVLSRLMAMTGRPWTDAQQAADERIRYENAVCEARMRYYAHDENGNLGSAVGTDELI